jgi:hypothetical protein
VIRFGVAEAIARRWRSIIERAPSALANGQQRLAVKFPRVIFISCQQGFIHDSSGQEKRALIYELLNTTTWDVLAETRSDRPG